MSDLDLDAIKGWKLTWTPYRVDEAGTVWEWEGRSGGGTRILVDTATHAYMTQTQRDTDALIGEVERLRAALVRIAANGAADHYGTLVARDALDSEEQP